MLKKRIFSLLKIVVSVGLLVWVITTLGWQNMFAALVGADLRWVAVAAVCYVLGVVVRGVRWNFLLRSLKTRPVGIMRLSALYFVSFFFNVFLPTGVGGDAVRIAQMGQAIGPGAASSVIVDRGIGIVATCLVALVALPFSEAPASFNQPLAVAAGVTVLGFAVAYWLAATQAVAVFDRLGRALPFLRPLTGNEKLRAAIVAFSLYRPLDLALSLGVSLIFTITNTLVYVALGNAAHVDLSISHYLLAGPVLALVLLIPFAMNGVGTRDVAYQYVFSAVGVPLLNIETMSLGYHILNLLAAVTGGILYAAIGTSEMLSKTAE
jgi:uncharacterized protein (TIRG00374 family)